MASASRNSRGETTRRQLMLCAEQVFSKSGLDGADLEKVREAAGAPKNAIYYHFKGRAGLYAATFLSRFRQFETLYQGAQSVIDEFVPEPRLEHFVFGLIACHAYLIKAETPDSYSGRFLRSVISTIPDGVDDRVLPITLQYFSHSVELILNTLTDFMPRKIAHKKLDIGERSLWLSLAAVEEDLEKAIMNEALPVARASAYVDGALAELISLFCRAMLGPDYEVDKELLKKLGFELECLVEPSDIEAGAHPEQDRFSRFVSSRLAEQDPPPVKLPPAMDNREKALLGAESVYAVRGADGLRMEAVSRASGVPLSTIYEHFKSKSDLLLSLRAYRQYPFVQSRRLMDEFVKENCPNAGVAEIAWIMLGPSPLFMGAGAPYISLWQTLAIDTAIGAGSNVVSLHNIGLDKHYDLVHLLPRLLTSLSHCYSGEPIIAIRFALLSAIDFLAKVERRLNTKVSEGLSLEDAEARFQQAIVDLLMYFRDALGYAKNDTHVFEMSEEGYAEALDHLRNELKGIRWYLGNPREIMSPP